MGTKQSKFTRITTIPDGKYLAPFGSGTNERIIKEDFFKQIKDETQIFIYPTTEQLQAADLVADPDFPIYVRNEETEYRLYKITSLAAGVNDIVMDNGTTATFQEEYQDIGFVVGPATSTNGALAVFDGTTGTQLANGPVPTTLGTSNITVPNFDAVGYARANADNTITMRSPADHKIDLSINNVDNTSDADKPISDETQAAFDALTIYIDDADSDLQVQINSRVQSVATIQDLVALGAGDVGSQYSVNEYHAASGVGGGTFEWDSARNKSDHNGFTVIDPSRTYPDFSIELEAELWYLGNGTSGAGCYVRLDAKERSLAEAGATEGDHIRNGFALRAAVLDHAGNYKLTINEPYTCKHINSVDSHPFNRTARLPSNTNIEFGPRGKITTRTFPSNFYAVFLAASCENIKVVNARIVGDYDTNPISDDNGQGFGFLIASAKNVILEYADVRNVIGDGIIITGNVFASAPELTDYGLHCEDVSLIKPKIVRAARNGLTVSSGRNVLIESAVISDVARFEPKSGIDIEPDSSDFILDNVVFNNPKTKDCTRGINVFLSLLSTSTPYTTVTVNDHEDRGSVTSFSTTMASECYGEVVFNNPKWIKPQFAFAPFTKRNGSCHLTINNPVAYGVPNANNVYNLSPNTTPQTYDFGGITLNNPSHIAEGASLRGNFFINCEASNHAGYADVTVNYPSQRSDYNSRYIVATDGLKLFDTPDNVVLASAADLIINTTDLYSKYTTDGAGTAQVFFYMNVFAEGIPVTIENTTGADLLVDMSFDNTTSYTIVPGGTAGQGIRSAENGARLKFMRKPGNIVQILEKIGTWTFY